MWHITYENWYHGLTIGRDNFEPVGRGVIKGIIIRTGRWRCGPNDPTATKGACRKAEKPPARAWGVSWPIRRHEFTRSASSGRGERLEGGKSGDDSVPNSGRLRSRRRTRVRESLVQRGVAGATASEPSRGSVVGCRAWSEIPAIPGWTATVRWESANALPVSRSPSCTAGRLSWRPRRARHEARDRGMLTCRNGGTGV